MTAVGSAAPQALPGFQQTLSGFHDGSIALPGSLLDLSAGGLRMAASLAVLALLWWPLVVAAAAGAWLAFAKAGRPGWACLVPVYNGLEFLRVAKLPAWLCALFLVPVVNLVLFAVTCWRVARAFRKRPRFALGLMLLPPVYMAILGMGPARYRRFEVIAGTAGPAEASRSTDRPRARVAPWPTPVRPTPASP